MNINKLPTELVYSTFDYLPVKDVISFSVTCRQAKQLLPAYMPRREKRILEETMKNWQYPTVDKTKFIAELLRDVDFVSCSTITIENVLDRINPSSSEFVAAFFWYGGERSCPPYNRERFSLMDLNWNYTSLAPGLNPQKYAHFLKTNIKWWFPSSYDNMPAINHSQVDPKKKFIFRILWEVYFEFGHLTVVSWPKHTSEEDAKIIVEVAREKKFKSITVRQNEYQEAISISEKAIEILRNFNQEVNLTGVDLDLSKRSKNLTVSFGIIIGLALITCWIALPILFGLSTDHYPFYFIFGGVGAIPVSGLSAAMPYAIAWQIKQRNKGNMHFVPPPIIPLQEPVPIANSSMETVD